MTYEELIAKQAVKIAELDEQVNALTERLHHIRLIICCIGGPLNDNKLAYSPAQLSTFQEIMGYAED